MRRFTCLAASLLMMLLCGPVAFADTRNRQAAPPVYLVMDVSGSMAGERLAAAQTVRRELVVQQRFTLPLASAGAVEAELRRRGFAIVSAEWEADVTVTVGSNDATAATLPGILAALTAGTVVPQPAGTRWIDVE